MNEKVVKFRTSVVGGFDRHDVISYIKLLSEERNMLHSKLAVQSSEEEAREELWNKAVQNHSQELHDAEALLRVLERKHEEIGKQIRILREHIEETRAKQRRDI